MLRAAHVRVRPLLLTIARLATPHQPTSLHNQHDLCKQCQARPHRRQQHRRQIERPVGDARRRRHDTGGGGGGGDGVSPVADGTREASADGGALASG